MKNTVAYSVLKYKHAEKLGESLNLGLLFIFPDVNRAEFVFPKSLIRLKKAFPDAEIDVIKSYLNSFKKQEKKIQELSKSLIFNYDFLLEELFFSSKSGPLQFENFNYGIITKDTQTTINNYTELYLNSYNTSPSEFKHKTGSQLIKKLHYSIIQKRPEFENIIIEEKTPIVSGKINFRVDLKWQNTTTNLVKGLSLDLESEEAITNKALLIQNQLNYLSQKISSLKARIDLLIAKPQDTSLEDTYNYALKILKEADANTEVYEENQIDVYTNKVIKEAH